MDRANEVLPVPGGPNSMMAAGGVSLEAVGEIRVGEGCDHRRSKSSFVEEKPFIDSQSPNRKPPP